MTLDFDVIGDMKPSIKRSRKEAESDTTECETTERPTRRIRGRRNKQRGQLTKRQVMPSYVPRYDVWKYNLAI